jgi:hypothetical protein
VELIAVNPVGGRNFAHFTLNVSANTFDSGDLSDKFIRPGWDGLYFGLMLAGLILLLGTIGYLCIQSTAKARQEALLQ